MLDEGFVDGDDGGGDVEPVFVAHDWIEDFVVLMSVIYCLALWILVDLSNRLSLFPSF